MSFRIRGFLIHLSASLVLALIACYVVFWIWYPSPLGQAIGVTSIVLLLLGVDVIAGPLLTLAVCKEGKKSLKFDLSVIILLQLSAFIYGFHILAQGRPVWIVFHENEFHIVRAYEAKNEYRKNAKPEYQKLSFTGPHWVAVRAPTNDNEKRKLFDGLTQGVIFEERADFYEPIANQVDLIKKNSLDLSLLQQFNNENNLETVLSQWSQADSFLPLQGEEKAMTVLVKRNDARIISTVNLRPF